MIIAMSQSPQAEPRMNPADEFLVRLLRGSAGLAGAVPGLLAWWDAERMSEGESLAAFLVRHDVFVKTAVKTCGMMAKGYVVPDLNALLAPRGADRLNHQAARFGRPEDAPHPARPRPAPPADQPDSISGSAAGKSAFRPPVDRPTPPPTAADPYRQLAQRRLSQSTTPVAAVGAGETSPPGEPTASPNAAAKHASPLRAARPDENNSTFNTRAAGRAPKTLPDIPPRAGRFPEPGAIAPEPAERDSSDRGDVSQSGSVTKTPQVESPVMAVPPATANHPASSRPPAKSAQPSASALEIGTTLGKCLLTEKVGQGASGLVFRALHTSLNIPVAVKVIQTELLEGDPTLLKQFRSEARLLAQLSHPNIVRVLDFEDDAAMPYLVLEYVEGLSLAELINQSGRVRLDRAIKVVTQVADGLAAAQKLGIVHRDVKPANILLTKDGAAKLADLGLAVVIGGTAGAGGMRADTMAGTAAYMSPEQAMAAGQIDHRSDMYSLGVTLYHVLTGQLPFRGRTRMEVMLKHVQEQPPLAHDVVPELAPAVSELVATMMAKSPAARYGTYEDLIAALARLPLAPDLPRPAGATAASPRPGREPREPAEESGVQAGSASSHRRSMWESLFGRSKKSSPPPGGS